MSMWVAAYIPRDRALGLGTFCPLLPLTLRTTCELVTSCDEFGGDSRTQPDDGGSACVATHYILNLDKHKAETSHISEY